MRQTNLSAVLISWCTRASETSQVIVQILLGTVTPIMLIGLTQIWKFTDTVRKRIYRAGRLSDRDWDFCDAMERRDRGATFFQEFSRIHHL